jgi:hypothetical protein
MNWDCGSRSAPSRHPCDASCWRGRCAWRALVGVLASLALARSTEGLLYGISAVDVPTLAGVSAILLAVSLVASYLPARQATRVDPMTTLKGGG